MQKSSIERIKFLEMMDKEDKNEFLYLNNFTVNQLIDIWLILYQEQVKKSTYSCTSGIINRSIRKQLGEFRVNELKPIIVQEAINHWVSIYSYSRYMLIINYLNRIIELGIKLNFITENPTNNVIIPKKKEELYRGKRISITQKMNCTFFLILSRIQK